MKYTVIVPRTIALTGDAGIVVSWRKEIGDAALIGETLAVVRGGEREAAVIAPVPGILTRKYALAGEAVATGEPLALLSGVPETLLDAKETYVPPRIAPPDVPFPNAEILALTPQERELARHDARAAQSAPHVFTIVRVDVSEALRSGAAVRVSILPFVVHSVAQSLARFPRLNAAVLSDRELRLCPTVNIAVLQRFDDRLVSLLLRDANKRSLLALARERDALADAAARNALSPHETRGATFTIAETPPGVWMQTGILRLPQAGLLTFAPPENAILTLCLTHDARAASPGLAAEFLREVQRGLEESAFLFAG